MNAEQVGADKIQKLTGQISELTPKVRALRYYDEVAKAREIRAAKEDDLALRARIILQARHLRSELRELESSPLIEAVKPLLATKNQILPIARFFYGGGSSGYDCGHPDYCNVLERVKEYLPHNCTAERYLVLTQDGFRFFSYLRSDAYKDPFRDRSKDREVFGCSFQSGVPFNIREGYSICRPEDQTRQLRLASFGYFIKLVMAGFDKQNILDVVVKYAEGEL